MFGYLRLILSILVLLSHLDIRFYGLNQGVIAVVIFYILAGFVVSHLYTNIFMDYKLFIKDRIRRIFPLYLFITILTILFITTTHFGSPHFTIFNIFSNLTIIPLNFYMLLDNAILTEPKWWLVPPAWSLGTELQAYLLLPFAIIYPKVRYIFITISFFIYMVANLNIIHPDYFGYRLIVGVMFIFLVGTSLQKVASKTQTKFDILFLFAVWFTTLIFISTLIYFGFEIKAYAKETTIGLIFGIPIIYTLSISNIKLPFNTILGSLSYGIFLSHFLSIWIVEYLSISKYKIESVLGISLLVALVGISLEKKLPKNKKSVEKM